MDGSEFGLDAVGVIGGGGHVAIDGEVEAAVAFKTEIVLAGLARSQFRLPLNAEGPEANDLGRNVVGGESDVGFNTAGEYLGLFPGCAPI